MPSPFFLAARADKVKIAIGVVVSIAESLADPAATIVLGKFFSNIQRLGDGTLSRAEFLHNVQTYTLCLVGVTGYVAVVNLLGYFIWMHNSYNLGHSARLRLYRVLIKQQTSAFDEHASLSGAALMHYKDIQDIEMAAGITSFEIISMAFGCIAELGVAFYFSWAVTLVCLAGMPFIILIGSLLSEPITARVKVSKGILDTISARVTWVLNSLQTVKILQKEHTEMSTLHRMLLKMRLQTNKYWMLFRLQQGLCRTFVLLIFMQGFYFGSFMVRKHGLPAGNVVSVFWCCLNSAALLQNLLSHLIEWNKGKASAERLAAVVRIDEESQLYDSIGIRPGFTEDLSRKFEKLGWDVSYPSRSSNDTSNETSNGTSNGAKNIVTSSIRSFSGSSTSSSFLESPDLSSGFAAKTCTPKGHVSFTDVVFAYPRRNDTVLTGLTMDFEAGSTTFVIGRSGSGKSTLASLLTKQYACEAGEITIDGHNIRLLSSNWIADTVYVCEQNSQMFDISIRENIRIGSRRADEVTDDQIMQAISDSCAAFINELPHALDSTNVGDLSGGEKQRVSLARARLCNSRIMIFDEVTSALDSHLRCEVLSKILHYRAGKTTIIITHDYSIIPHGYPIYLIEDGVGYRYETVSDVPRNQNLLEPPNLQPTQVQARSFTQQYDSAFSLSDVRQTCKSEAKKPLSLTHILSKLIAATSLASNSLGSNSLGSISWGWFLFKTVPSKFLLYLGLCLTLIHAAINPVFSFCFSQLVMGILDPAANKSTLWALLILMCAVLDGCVVWGEVVLNLMAEKWLAYAREKLFTQILGAEHPFRDGKPPSYYTKLLLSDSEKCAEILTRYWPGVLNMLMLGISGSICSSVFGWKLTLVGISLLPVFVISNAFYKSLTTKWTKTRESLRANVIRLTLDVTSESGFRTVKAQNLERYFENNYVEREGQLNSINKPMLSQIGLGYGLLKCFPYSLESLLLWYGSHLIGTGEYKVQQTMTVFSMLMFTIVTIDQLTSVIGSVGTGFESLQRYAAAYHDYESQQSQERNARPLVTTADPHYTPTSARKPQWQEIYFYNVSKYYAERAPGLSGFTHQVHAGEAVAIVGPSGIGKSTLARMLVGLEKPSTGEIIIDGQWNLDHLSLFDIRRNIGLLNQTPVDFFDGSIQENLLYGLDANDTHRASRIIDVCKQCGAHEFICQLQDQYETRIKPGLLSGGQQQRLAIARILLREPKVLILDECTSALDPESQRVVNSMIVDLKNRRQMIIIIITHQCDSAAVADRVIQLN